MRLRGPRAPLYGCANQSIRPYKGRRMQRESSTRSTDGHVIERACACAAWASRDARVPPPRNFSKVDAWSGMTWTTVVDAKNSYSS